MPKPRKAPAITEQDLLNLTVEQAGRAKDHKRLQRFLDATSYHIDLDRASAQELARIKSVVDHSAAALAGPNILVWNNICRPRAGLSPVFRKP